MLLILKHLYGTAIIAPSRHGFLEVTKLMLPQPHVIHEHGFLIATVRLLNYGMYQN